MTTLVTGMGDDDDDEAAAVKKKALSFSPIINEPIHENKSC